MVIWTNDNGAPAPQRRGGSNLPLKGNAYSVAEGGMRVPLIARWPGHIPAGTVCRELITLMDLYPTFAHLAGAEIPNDRKIDGHDIRPLLFGQTGALSPYEAFYYYYVNQLQAVRSGPWKLYLRGGSQSDALPESGCQLYNLVEDPREETDLAEHQTEVVERLQRLMQKAREDLGEVDRPGLRVRPVANIDNPQPRVIDPDASPPNLVVIMTDNHGPWTLGCYGNPDVRTPNIDRLATEGMLFERAFASNAVCSPTRATFLTGLIPSQHGVHCYLQANRLQMGPEAHNTLDDYTSLGEVLGEAGYTCGLVGKWHLGDNLRPQEGFSAYWITKPHGHTVEFYDQPIIYDGKVYTEPRYTTDLWTEHAIKFLKQNRGSQPFFLLLTYNGPYGLGGSLLKPARNRHAAYYADKILPSFPRNPIHPWQVNNRQFMNNVLAMRRYAAEISGVDDGIGEVMNQLQNLGLDDETLVVFTADQGLGCGQHGLWGMGDHTRPLHAFDATMHIPLIFRHNKAIPAGRRSDMLVANYDLMPTILGYLGLGDRMPSKPPSPGRDFARYLRGEQIDWDNVVFYEFEDTRAIRTEDWKLILRHPAGPNELYHLAQDPGEWVNLYHEPAYEDTRAGLTQRLNRFFDTYAEPRYDLWKGGSAQTRHLAKPGPPGPGKS